MKTYQTKANRQRAILMALAWWNASIGLVLIVNVIHHW